MQKSIIFLHTSNEDLKPKYKKTSKKNKKQNKQTNKKNPQKTFCNKSKDGILRHKSKSHVQDLYVESYKRLI